MKRAVLFLALVLGATFCAFGQNIQVHHDFGRFLYEEQAGRSPVTLTYEAFKPDALGSWFYFIDADITSDGVTGAYTEISREFNLWKDAPLAAHVEYNGGLAGSFIIPPAYLAGLAYNWHNRDFTFTLSLQALYKYCGGHNGQVTLVWNSQPVKGKIYFNGFADLWTTGGGVVFLSEPQLWVALTPAVYLGGEVELSHNFARTGFSAIPTVAVRFNL